MTLSDAEILITGDFNARCADRNYDITDENCNWNSNIGVSKISYHDSAFRISEDKILNSRGKKLLDFIESIGITILNGSVLGDIAGKYTCHLYNGSNIVDYVLASKNVKNKVNNMIVNDFNRFSDHCYLSLNLDITLPRAGILSASQYDKVPKRYSWHKEHSPNYFKAEMNKMDTKSVLIGISETQCHSTKDIDSINREIITIYHNAAESIGDRTNRRNNKINV